LTLSRLRENRAVSTPEKKPDKRISSTKIIILVCEIICLSGFSVILLWKPIGIKLSYSHLFLLK
jgi:hypothetical protein